MPKQDALKKRQGMQRSAHVCDASLTHGISMISIHLAASVILEFMFYSIEFLIFFVVGKHK